MYNFHPANENAPATFAPANDPCARLNWLAHWNAEAERHARLFRHAREEEQVGLMRRPVATREAYARFGLLLGAFVPAAIFYRMFNYGFQANGSGFGQLWFPLLLVAMNLACALTGGKWGARVGGTIDAYEHESWHRMSICAMGLGALWGLNTGAVGGVLYFGVGSLFGAFIALPVGMLGFLIFTLLHRLMARGGMIDARHVWPLAYGVVLTITALILSPNL